MPPKEAEEKHPRVDRCGLTAVLDPAIGRASLIEDPSTSPEIAKALEEMSRDGIKRMSSGWRMPRDR
jgi:hypothetical protein